MNLTLLADRYAIAKLPPTETIPMWATQGNWFSVTRAPGELSIVTVEKNLPAGVVANNGWRVFQVQGPIDFSEVGVLNSLTAPLAQTSISIFAISTFNTDYVLVKEENLKQATEALQNAGHAIVSS